MAVRQSVTFCQICQQPKPRGEVFHGDLIHGPVREAIRKRYPNWSDDHYVCAADLHRFRTEYLEDVLKEERGELTTLEQRVPIEAGRRPAAALTRG